MDKLYDRIGDFCTDCDEGILVDKMDCYQINLICDNCGVMYDRFTKKPKCENTAIEILIKEYTEEKCTFDNLDWVAEVSEQYVQSMEDSQVRCLLHTFVEDFKKRSKKTYISYKINNAFIKLTKNGYWGSDQVENYLSNLFSQEDYEFVEELEVQWSNGSEIDMDEN